MVLQFCRRPSGRVLGEMGQNLDFVFHDSMTVWICEFSNFTYFDGDFDGLLQGPNWVPTGSQRGPYGVPKSKVGAWTDFRLSFSCSI